jgi:hypothetical protein
MTGSVINNMKSVRTPENIHHVEPSARKSVKHLTQKLNLEASLTYGIIPDEKLFLYKTQHDDARRVAFCGDNVFRGQSSSTLKHTVQ